MANYANFTTPQFVDATGTGGLVNAFGTASGAIAQVGSGAFSTAGILSPEAMTVAFSGTTATVGLPQPWAVVTSGGSVTRAHGTVTGQDTQTYSVPFSTAVPASGSVTAYLVATPVAIQQNPIALPGPPPGHPSWSPTFVPTYGYATNMDSVSLSVTTVLPDNVTAFELLRTTLTAGQATVNTWSFTGQYRAGTRQARPLGTVNGGLLTQAQAQQVVTPSTGGLTNTLPLSTSAGGLLYRFANTSAGAWTIAASGSVDVFVGALANSGTTTSLQLAPGVHVDVLGDGAGRWRVMSASPSYLLGGTNAWAGANAFTQPVTVAAATASGHAINLGQLQWTAGPVSGVVGATVSGGVLTIPSAPGQQWTAGAVSSVVGGTVSSGKLTINFPAAPAQEWTAGYVSSVVGGTVAGNVLTITPTGFSHIQVFSATGTFTVPAGTTKVRVTVVGGGGGGGGNPASSGGAGGGAGGASIGIFAVNSGTGYAVTVGAGGSAGSPTVPGGNGGTSSFSSFCSASGGNGGAIGLVGATSGGQTGGTGTGGALNLTGGIGMDGQGASTALIGGSGGASLLGGGGRGAQASGVTPLNGQALGSGAGGSYGTAAGNGGVGAAGVVIVEY